MTMKRTPFIQSQLLYDMINSLSNMETTENDLKSFKSYIEAERLKSEDENRFESGNKRSAVYI